MSTQVVNGSRISTESVLKLSKNPKKIFLLKWPWITNLALVDPCQWEFALKKYTCSETISNDYVKSDIYIPGTFSEYS